MSAGRSVSPADSCERLYAMAWSPLGSETIPSPRARETSKLSVPKVTCSEISGSQGAVYCTNDCALVLICFGAVYRSLCAVRVQNLYVTHSLASLRSALIDIHQLH